MAVRHIPSQRTKRWSGIYRGDFYGDIWRTFNVDLDKREGKVSLSRRMTPVADSDDANDSNLSVIAGFVKANPDSNVASNLDGNWWGNVHRGRLFRSATNDPSLNWGQDSLDSTPTLSHDLTVFHTDDSTADSLRHNQLFVTTDCDIAVLNDCGNSVWDGSWLVSTKSKTALDSDFYHPIETWNTKKLTLVGNGHRIITINDSEDVSDSRLVLPTYLRSDHIFFTRDRAWILCGHKFGGEGAIVEWDGVAINPNQIHRGYGTKMMSGVNYREVPIVVNNKGEILEYTGNGFALMSRGGQVISFPIAEELENSFRTDAMSVSSRSPSLQPRGMDVGEDGLIYINTAEPRLNSYRQGGGIWCLNPLTGRLYNKYSLGRYGDSVDFGMQSVFAPGGIKTISSDSSSNFRGLLAGGRLTTIQASTFVNLIWNLADVGGTSSSRGYFITQFIPASEIRELWSELWVRFRRFVTSTNRIIVKGRGVRSLQTQDGEPIEYSITQTSGTTFTITSVNTNDALEIGDEVEILNGNNAGVLAHISVISGAHGGAQTITVDETLPNSGATSNSLARFDRWKRLGTISNATKYEDKVNVGIAGSFIQFKVELRGRYHEMEVESLIAVSQEHTKAE